MEKEQGKEQVKEPERINIIIPQCCREGWDSCKHSVKKEKVKRRRQVGL